VITHVLLIRVLKGEVNYSVGSSAAQELNCNRLQFHWRTPPTATTIPGPDFTSAKPAVHLRTRGLPRICLPTGNSACGLPGVCWLHPSRPPHSSCTSECFGHPHLQIQHAALAANRPNVEELPHISGHGISSGHLTMRCSKSMA